MADVQLKIVDGPDTGREFEIGGALVVGRDPSAGLVVQDPEVSRRHASIAASSAGAEVSDLGSTNGTFVNGERIQEPRMLQSGDRVRVGVTVFEVSVAIQATRMAEAIPDAGATAIASVATPEELERQVAAEEALRHAEPEGSGKAAAEEAQAELEHSDSDNFPTVVPEEDEPAPPAPSAEPVANVGQPTEAGPGGAGVPSPEPASNVGQPTEAGPGGAGVPSPEPVSNVGQPTEAGPGGAGVPSPSPQPPVASPPPPPPPPAPPPVPGAPPFAGGQAPPFSAPPPQGGGKPGLLRRIFRRGGS